MCLHHTGEIGGGTATAEAGGANLQKLVLTYHHQGVSRQAYLSTDRLHYIDRGSRKGVAKAPRVAFLQT